MIKCSRRIAILLERFLQCRHMQFTWHSFSLSVKAQVTVTWWFFAAAAGQKWLFKNDSAQRCQSTAGWAPITITLVILWKAKWLCRLSHDGYELVLAMNSDQSFFVKTAQRWFRGQRIRTIDPFFSRVWRGSSWGGGEQRDHWHWSSRSVRCTHGEREIIPQPALIAILHSVCDRRRYEARAGHGAAAPGGHWAAEKRLPLRTGWVHLCGPERGSHDTS